MGGCGGGCSVSPWGGVGGGWLGFVRGRFVVGCWGGGGVFVEKTKKRKGRPPDLAIDSKGGDEHSPFTKAKEFFFGGAQSTSNWKGASVTFSRARQEKGRLRKHRSLDDGREKGLFGEKSAARQKKRKALLIQRHFRHVKGRHHKRSFW